MPVYAIIHEYNSPEFLHPPKEEHTFGLLGRLVYKDTVSAIEAAQKHSDCNKYAFGFTNIPPLRVYEVDADWDKHTTEVPDVDLSELEEYYGRNDPPKDIESAVDSLNDSPDEGRYLTKISKVGKLIRVI